MLPSLVPSVAVLAREYSMAVLSRPKDGHAVFRHRFPGDDGEHQRQWNHMPSAENSLHLGLLVLL